MWKLTITDEYTPNGKSYEIDLGKRDGSRRA